LQDLKAGTEEIAERVSNIISFLDTAVGAAATIVGMVKAPPVVIAALALAKAATSKLSAIPVSSIKQAMDTTIDKLRLTIGFVMVAVSKIIEILGARKTDTNKSSSTKQEDVIKQPNQIEQLVKPEEKEKERKVSN